MGPLEAVAVRVLGTVAKRGGSAAAQHLLEIESQHARQLKQLGEGVDALLKGAYEATLVDLEISAGVNTSRASVEEHLLQAQRNFTLAYGNLQRVDPLQAAWAAVHLAILCLATERRDEAIYWARRADEGASRAFDHYAAQAKDRADARIGRLRLTGDTAQGTVLLGGGAGIGLGAGVAGMTIASGGLALGALAVAFGAVLATRAGMEKYQKHQSRNAEIRMNEIAGFVGDIQDFRRRLGDRALPPA
jgi:hypothetical protein